jgi:D-hydroxyproline dehydrogenase subunit gamma
MSGTVRITIDGRQHDASSGATVAAALVDAGTPVFRTSVTGAPRGPVCGMGVCFECRVTIDGRPHQRACLVLCEPGMSIRTVSESDA